MRSPTRSICPVVAPLLAVALLVALGGCGKDPVGPPPPVDLGTVTLTTSPVVSGLASPVYLTSPTNDARLFIVEQPGRIRIVKSGALLPTPFLDITSKVVFGSEQGLLIVAFDPAYATNGRFYVYYTGASGDIFVDRYTVSAN